MTDRRSFLASLAAAPTAVRTGLAAPIPDGSGDALPASAGSSAAEGPWDFSWIDKLNGTYRQVFDCGEVSDDPLRVVKNYLNGFRDVMGLEHPIVNAVVGIAGRSFPINAGDALWAKYQLAERWKVPPGPDGKLPVTNVYAEAAAELKARGAVFWMCNNALTRIVGMFATDSGRPVDEVRAELVAGLMPGVILVPAHAMLLGMVQHRGCTYEKL